MRSFLVHSLYYFSKEGPQFFAFLFAWVPFHSFCHLYDDVMRFPSISFKCIKLNWMRMWINFLELKSTLDNKISLHLFAFSISFSWWKCVTLTRFLWLNMRLLFIMKIFTIKMMLKVSTYWWFCILRLSSVPTEGDRVLKYAQNVCNFQQPSRTVDVIEWYILTLNSFHFFLLGIFEYVRMFWFESVLLTDEIVLLLPLPLLLSAYKRGSFHKIKIQFYIVANVHAYLHTVFSPSLWLVAGAWCWIYYREIHQKDWYG